MRSHRTAVEILNADRAFEMAKIPVVDAPGVSAETLVPLTVKVSGGIAVRYSTENVGAVDPVGWATSPSPAGTDIIHATLSSVRERWAEGFRWSIPGRAAGRVGDEVREDAFVVFDGTRDGAARTEDASQVEP